MHESQDSGVELLPLATLEKNDTPTSTAESIGNAGVVEGSALSQSLSTSSDDPKKGFASTSTPTLGKMNREGEIRVGAEGGGMHLGTSYRLYKRRFLGLGALVVFNIICACMYFSTTPEPSSLHPFLVASISVYIPEYSLTSSSFLSSFDLNDHSILGSLLHDIRSDFHSLRLDPERDQLARKYRSATRLLNLL